MSTTDLENLARAADAGEAPPPEPGQAPGAAPGGPPPGDPNVQALGMCLELFREAATAMLEVKSLQVTLDTPKVEVIAGVVAPVLTKYGINLSTTFDGPEWQAAFVAGPLLWECASQLRMELAAKKAKPVDEPAPGAKGG